MNARDGWYPDPTGAPQQRYSDGQQWTAAVAAPAVVTMPVFVPVASTARQDWAQRHPAWTALIVFWLACMVWSWTWLAPTLAVIASLAWVSRWDRRRRARLTAEADEQNELILDGDPRGIYANAPRQRVTTQLVYWRNRPAYPDTASYAIRRRCR